MEQREMEMAAMEFTIANLGQERRFLRQGMDFNAIRQAYHQLDGEIRMETGESIRGEYDSWMRDLRQGDKMTLKMWEDDKKKYAFVV